MALVLKGPDSIMVIYETMRLFGAKGLWTYLL